MTLNVLRISLLMTALLAVAACGDSSAPPAPTAPSSAPARDVSPVSPNASAPAAAQQAPPTERAPVAPTTTAPAPALAIHAPPREPSAPALTPPTVIAPKPEAKDAPAEQAIVLRVGAPKAAPTELPREEIMLPSKFEDIAVGGGGRYLLILMKSRRELAVFDMEPGRIVKTLNLRASDCDVFGGADTFFIADYEHRVIERWRLEDQSRELAQTAAWLATDPARRWLSLSPMSIGPIHTGGTRAIDTRTLGEFEIEAPWYTNVRDGARGIPSSDDQLVFTSEGAFQRNYKPFEPERFSYAVCVPTGGGNLLLTARTESWSNGAPPYRVYAINPVTHVFDLPFSAMLWHTYTREIPLQRRLHLSATGERFVVVPPGDDRLVIYKLDVKALLAKQAKPHLFITSSPPRRAYRGKEYACRITAQSTEGGLQYELTLKPEGMTLSPDGQLRWQVPADFAGDGTKVQLVITDRTGASQRQTFELGVW